MDGLNLLDEARAAGMMVRAEGDRLIVRGPRKAEALAKSILARKAEVLGAMARTTPFTPPTSHDPADALWMAALTAWPEDRLEDWSERAAILEFDGGLSRVEAEQAAYHDVQALMTRESLVVGLAPTPDPEGIDFKSNSWRWEVANWPHEAWSRWRRRAGEILAAVANPTVQEIKAAEHAAYREISELRV